MFFSDIAMSPFSGRDKKILLSHNKLINLPGQELKIPAVPPCLTHYCVSSLRVQTYADSCSRSVHSVAHTPKIRFRLPLEVHSVSVVSAAISPPATLFEKNSETYSLSLNGLAYYSTVTFLMSRLF